MKPFAISLFVLLSFPILQAGDGDWPSFRGPDASGVADGANLPDSWNGPDGTHIKWKAPIPGLSHASPIVWGDHIIVASAISSKGKASFKHGLYGSGEASDDRSSHQFSLFCLDKKTGKLIWQQVATEGAPIDKRHVKATYANSTPATNGKVIVSLFGSQGLFAHDMNGKPLWKAEVGRMNLGAYDLPDYEWGSAGSPIIYKNLVFVQADTQGDDFLMAFDVSDGHLVWKTPRDQMPSWSTPGVYTGRDRHELITNAPKSINGYDPLTGKELWHLGGSSDITAPTPIFTKDLILVASGRRPIKPMFAIKPGANGDITLKEGESSSDAIAWSKRGVGPYMPTPIIYGKLLFSLNNNGVLDCYDLETGESHFRERVPHSGGGFSASPVAADGKLYLSGEDGDVFVVKAAPTFQLISKNPMGELIMATPAISGKMMFVRARDSLFAVGE